jgi:uroporphyrinogen decarboxylase
VRQVIDQYRSVSGDSIGHVFNLGHGISQFTAPDSVGVLVDEVHRYGVPSARA